MSIKPLGDNVVLERIEAATKSKGGIIIPETAQKESQEAKVIAVGTGIFDNNGKKIPLDVKVGDKVLFKKWGGNDVAINGKDLVIVKESDILAII